jgi:hypothetical protein
MGYRRPIPKNRTSRRRSADRRPHQRQALLFRTCFQPQYLLGGFGKTEVRTGFQARQTRPKQQASSFQRGLRPVHGGRIPQIPRPLRAGGTRTRACDWDRSADHIRASGHSGCIAMEASLHAKTGRIHGCTRTLRKTSDSSCTAGAVHTWPSAAVTAARLSGRCRRLSGHYPLIAQCRLMT